MDIDEFIRSVSQETVTHEQFVGPDVVFVSADDTHALVSVGVGFGGTRIRFNVVNGKLITSIEEYTL